MTPPPPTIVAELDTLLPAVLEKMDSLDYELSESGDIAFTLLGEPQGADNSFSTHLRVQQRTGALSDSAHFTAPPRAKRITPDSTATLGNLSGMLMDAYGTENLGVGKKGFSVQFVGHVEIDQHPNDRSALPTIRAVKGCFVVASAQMKSVFLPVDIKTTQTIDASTVEPNGTVEPAVLTKAL